MRLLIVNPNTSHGVTDKIQSAANEVAMGKDRFTTRSAAFGPKLIVTQADAERAAKGVVETVKSHSQPCDGVILASFGDTGAREVRQLRPDIPVIGIASAAFSVVRSLAGPFGIVTFGENLVPGLRNKAIEAGLSENLMLISAVKSHEIGDPGTVQVRFKDEIQALCADMEGRGAQSIVLGGGPLAGLATRLRGCVQVPIIDGTQAAVSILRALVAPTASPTD